ncbi:glucose transporter type 3 [Drosophila guanche]|nr:glucose transporter type 3 [Drosophila guanche]XP_034130134.1 glucose transporter type 3 [Drosophila guanche]SPP83179.1 blast:Glucose transporter type 3 [Drosophila guanche]
MVLGRSGQKEAGKQPSSKRHTLQAEPATSQPPEIPSENTPLPVQPNIKPILTIAPSGISDLTVGEDNTGQCLATVIGNIGTFCFGIAIGWSAPAKAMVMHNHGYSFTPSKQEWTWVCALLTLGAATWSIPMGMLMKSQGCKRVMILQLVPIGLGWSMLIFAQSVTMLYVGRFMQGMCGGALCVVVPVYTVEISHIRHRGALVSVFHGAFMLGVIYSYAISPFLDLWIINIVNVALLLLFLLQFLIPESPYYYWSRGNYSQADKCLRWLHGKEYDTRRAIRQLTIEGTRSETSLRLKRKKARRSLCRASALTIMQTLSGSTVFIFYSINILLSLHLNYECSAALAVADICGFLVCFMLVDVAGRRPLLIVTSLVTFVCTMYTGMCFQLKLITDHENSVSWASLVSMCLCSLAYTAGLGPLTWLINVELFVTPMRPLGCSLSATFNWLTAFAVVMWYGSGPEYRLAKPGVFFLMATVSLLVCIYGIIFLPETKGLTTHRIQQKLGGSMNQRNVPSIDSSSDESGY